MLSLLAAGLITLAQTPSGTIYLECAVESATGANPHDWYPAGKTVDQAAMLRDAFASGAVGFVIEQPTTWAIDLDKREIGTPERGSAMYTIEEATASLVAGRRDSITGSWFTFRYNQINRRLTLTTAPNEEVRADWKEVTGGEMPILITTVHQCQKVSL